LDLENIGDIDPKTIEEFINKIAKKIVELKLSVPAIFFLESIKPISFIGSQALVFFRPIVLAAFNIPNAYDIFIRIMEDRENVEKLIQKIEQLEEENKKGG